MPSLFASADASSLEGQRRHIRGVIWRSRLAVLAAVGGVASWRVGDRGFDLLAIVTMCSLLVLLAVEFRLKTGRADRAWYDGRAVAESAKSLTWRFAVRGVPFDRIDGNQSLRFIGELAQLLRDVQLEPVVLDAERPVVPGAVNALRASSLGIRKEVYIRDRIGDQQEWYAKQARINQSRAERWSIALLTVELAGIGAAAFKIVGWVSFDLAGVIAALIGVGAARLGVGQYATNARAYSFATAELAIVRARLEAVDCNSADAEASWSTEVGDAEEAVSREHTMWRASRSKPG
ncbi:DUF4231 domain-containing protein [Kribbella sp. NPDC020789]